MKVGYLIDPPEGLLSAKDSSIELMRASAEAGDEIVIFETAGMLLGSDGLTIRGERIELLDGHQPWYRSLGPWDALSSELGLIMLRLDPPVTRSYRYACSMLELAAAAGTPTFNKPASVLAREEKIAALAHPQLCPPTLIGSDPDALIAFAAGLEGGCAIKPLNSMGGSGVFVLPAGDSNIPVAIDQLMQSAGTVVVQERLADIGAGDRRVFVIDGTPYPIMLNRVPLPGAHLANMVAGGKPVAQELGKPERAIAEAVGPDLKQAGILFAGIDVIGGKLTEINVTCPTGLVQVREQTGQHPAREAYACARKRAEG